MAFFRNSQRKAMEAEVRSATQRLSDLQGFLETIKSRATGGESVNRTSAQKVPAVASCIKAIRDDMSGIPLKLMRKLPGGGTESATDHRVYDLLKLQPNPEMKAFDWQKTRFPEQILDGNSYSFIERSRLNPVKWLWPLDPSAVTIERTTSRSNKRGKIRYRVLDGYKVKYYDPEYILHIKNFSNNGITGFSDLLVNGADIVSMGLELNVFGTSFFKNGFFPSGYFKLPGKLSDKDTWLDNVKKKFGGNRKTSTPMTLEAGMDFVQTEIKLIDSQYQELRTQNKTDICGLLGVPLSRISVAEANSNYNNSEQEQRRYYQSCLLPWAVADEQEMSIKLLTPEERKSGLMIKYNFRAFLRADSKTQAEINQIESNSGMPLNRILAREDRAPVPYGDKGLVQVNMTTLEDISEGVSEGKTNGEPGTPEQKSFQGKRAEKRGRLDKIRKGRAKVRARNEPKLKAAFDKIVEKELKSLGKAANKHLESRSDESFLVWLDGFYDKFKSDLSNIFEPVARKYSLQMAEIIKTEVDESPDDVDEKLLEDVNYYITGAVDQYVGYSKNGIRNAVVEDGLVGVQKTISAWEEKRADMATKEHITGIASIAAWSVTLLSGYRLKWYAVGKSCPICKVMNGRTVSSRTESFNAKDEKFTDAAGKEVSYRQTKFSPLHKGCDCVVAAG